MLDLLLEGGVAGHMSHLYEDPSLTFTKMKEILLAASEGELEGAEKVDGQNLFLSYDINSGKAKAARNKSNIKAGGLSASELAQKFAGRGTVEDAFNDAFEAFERAVEKFSDEEKLEIFGPNTNIYYNAEIQDPRNANVINYDFKALKIHRDGHAEFDRETGAPTDKDVTKNTVAIQNALERVQDELEGEHRVEMNALRKLLKLEDESIIQDTLARLEAAINEEGISDNQTVGDYVVARLSDMIDEAVNLESEAKKLVIKKILGVKGININKILKMIPDPQDKATVRELIKRSADLKRKAIEPIEDIIHDFAVEMLSIFQSAYVVDNSAEAMRLRDEVKNAIEQIQKSGSKEANEVLVQQLKKLEKLDKTLTAAEGFVFIYDGKTYKLTGNFAPINQILGLFKYGRGKIPPIQKVNEQEEINIVDDVSEDGRRKRIGIYSGRFQPMGRHHYNAYKSIVNSDLVDDVYVVTSDKTSLPKSPFNFKEKKRIISAHGVPANRIVKVKNPYDAKEVARRYNKDNIEMVYFVGGKDMAENPRFSKKNGTTKDGYKWSLAITPFGFLDIPELGRMSGTRMRELLSGGDVEIFTKIMGPDFQYSKEIVNLILNKLRYLKDKKFTAGQIKKSKKYEQIEKVLTGMVNDIIMSEKKDKKKKYFGDTFYDIAMLHEVPLEEEEDEEEVEETSMASAAGGYLIPLGSKPEDYN